MIAIQVADDGETVTAIYNGERRGDEWINLDRNLPQVNNENVSVTWYYRNGRLRFEIEPNAPSDEI